jgi:serine/threonine protein kinase
MFDDLRDSPYIRVADDTVAEHSMFAYKYVRDHLLWFFLKARPLSTIKRILRDALRGLATLHDKGIVHTDIKPNNILVEWKENGDDIIVEQAQIADIEDAAYVPDDCIIEGAQRGNWMWRSPEAHVAGPMHKPTDMFSFGLVVSPAQTLTSPLD